KHCVLRYIKGVWHVRDLGSTNGTTINSQKIMTEHSLLPDDELGIAGHYYKIDYEPVGPATLITNSQVMDEDIVETRKQHSLMELAGLEGDGTSKPKRRTSRPARPPERIVRLSADEGEFEDALPERVKQAPKPKAEPPPDDFFKLIEDEVKKDKK